MIMPDFSVKDVAEAMVSELNTRSTEVIALAEIHDKCDIPKVRKKLEEALTELGVSMCATILTLSEALGNSGS